MVTKQYHIVADLGSAICLPKSENYQLKICIGELSWDSGPPKQGKKEGMETFCRWNCRINEDFENCH